MGLKGSGDIKKDLKVIAPSAWLPSPDAGASIVIDDGTGCIYQTISSASNLADLRTKCKNFLSDVRLCAPNATHYICVLDFEKRKPANKSVLRNQETESTPAFSEEEILKYGARISMDATPEEYESAAEEIKADGIERKLCKETTPAFGFATARALRTHRIRNEMFCKFIEAFRNSTSSEFPVFDVVLVDGAESLEKSGKFTKMKFIAAGVGDSHDAECVESDVSDDRAGEADLRVVEVLRNIMGRKTMVGNGGVLLRTKDTDLIPILLCDVDNNIDGAVWSEGNSVMLNIGPSKRDGPDELIDISVLRDGIRAWPREKHGAHVWPEKNSFERVFSLVCILGGTDFVEKPPGVGWQRLWNYFCDIGFSFFVDLPLNVVTTDYPFFATEEILKRVMDALEHFVRGLLATDHRVVKAVKVRGERYASMLERAKKSLSAPPGDLKPDTKGTFKPHSESLRRKLMKRVPSCKSVIEEAGERNSRQGIVPQTYDWIRVYCAQALWNYLYWNRAEADCLMSADGESGIPHSIFGWERDRGGTVVRSSAVSWTYNVDISPWIEESESTS